MSGLKKQDELMIHYVEILDEEQALKLANELLKEGMEPPYLLELINQGMVRVGKLYEQKDYYIADLIMAGLIFKQVLELDQMVDHFHTKHTNRIGKMVLGTVKGDIHDIGKDIVRGMMEANGFEVIDLGVDVPKEQFVKKFEEHRPEIIGLSGVLTYTVESMKEVVDAFEAAGLRDKVKFIVGGNHLTSEACQYIGADGFSTDASVGVRVCREWIEMLTQGATEHD